MTFSYQASFTDDRGIVATSSSFRRNVLEVSLVVSDTGSPAISGGVTCVSSNPFRATILVISDQGLISKASIPIGVEVTIYSSANSPKS